MWSEWALFWEFYILFYFPLVTLAYRIAFRGHRWRNWFHGISCDGNNHSELSASEKRLCHSLSSEWHHGSVWQIHQGGRGRNRAPFRNGLPLLLLPFRYSPVEILVTQSLIQNSKLASPSHFKKYQSVPNGSGMQSESKAMPELLNLSPRLSSLQVHVNSVCLCVTSWRWNQGGWTLCELFSLT